VDRDKAGGPVVGVDAERPAQDEPGIIGCPDMDELPGLGAIGQRRGVIGLEPMTGQELARFDELGVEQLHVTIG
jgi:hypothetical protein